MRFAPPLARFVPHREVPVATPSCVLHHPSRLGAYVSMIGLQSRYAQTSSPRIQLPQNNMDQHGNSNLKLRVMRIHPHVCTIIHRSIILCEGLGTSPG